MNHLTHGARIVATCVLMALLAACGVRGALVPPDREVLIETDGNQTPPSPDGQDDEARFPAPEAVN